jgi:UDP-2,3-diacylglucosamine pyrophosphatase LpxH
MKAPVFKYVCISDLHLGEEDSLLTNLYRNHHKADPLNLSPVMICLKDCLYNLIKDAEGFPENKPALIILGDGLDLALSQDNTTVMVFERFIESFFWEVPESLFKEIIYIPGNHDHHIWETAREIQYAEYIKRHYQNVEIPISWHRTRAVPEKPTDFINSPLLESAVQRVLKRKNVSVEVPVNILYPNFIYWEKGERNKFIVFHHGHFFERLYYLMSYLNEIIFSEKTGKFPPDNIDDIEAENFAWIDFFWSTLGRSGEAGEKLETIWELLQSERGKEKLIENLSRGLAKKLDIPLIPGDFLEEKTLRVILNFLVKLHSEKLEKMIDEDMSKEFYQLLKNYLGNAVFNQIKDETGLENSEIENSEMVLVFGHTHKPLSRMEKIEPYKNWIKIYNTGGWVVDKPGLDPLYGGMIVFVDDKGNTAGLKVFSLGKKEKPYPVEIQSSEDEPGELYRYLSEKVEKDKSCWEKLLTTLHNAAEIRAAHLRKIVSE